MFRDYPDHQLALYGIAPRRSPIPNLPKRRKADPEEEMRREVREFKERLAVLEGRKKIRIGFQQR